MTELLVSDKKTLLQLARQSIETFFEGTSPEIPPNISPALQAKRGIFVTLHKGDQLRGCIGTFFADKPLSSQVLKMARAAAFEDSRFTPVQRGELTDITIEISVLSPLRIIQTIAEIEIGKHGIYISRNFHRGVLLPQVATEQHWDTITFLEHTCLKAGLPRDAWQKGATIEIFSADIFGEKHFDHRPHTAN